MLDELERLRGAIRARRGQPRAEPVAATGQLPAGRGGALSEMPRLAEISAVREAFTGAVTLPAPRPPAEPAVPPVAPPPSNELQESEAAGRPTRSGRTRLLVASLAVTLALVAGWFLPRDPAPRPPAESAAVSREAVAPPRAAEPPTTPVDPHPLRIDVVTSRPVWMRVTVDGRIAIERILPPGERLPFGADKSIEVRAGDAGAVSVWVGTVDQGPLGRDGQVVRRLFEAPVR